MVHSSIHRKARADQIKPPETLEDLLDFAFDDNDERYPIYRNREEYSVQCVATGININFFLIFSKFN